MTPEKQLHLKKHKQKMCPHNRRKTVCKSCCIGDGYRGSFCFHKKLKYSCKECGGKGICEHNKGKFKCRICKNNKTNKIQLSSTVPQVTEAVPSSHTQKTLLTQISKLCGFPSK